MKGININFKDSEGKKPIFYCNNPEIKQLLSKRFITLSKLAFNYYIYFFIIIYLIIILYYY